MLCNETTSIGHTMTAEGKIPHLYWNGILLPVKLDVNLGSVRETLGYQAPMRIAGGLVYNLGSVRETLGYQAPMRIAGGLVYALPGGGRYVA